MPRSFRRPARRRDGRPPSPFVVGVGRSGTTLLRLMLDAHPELAVPPETHFAPAVIRAARNGATAEELVALLAGERRWGDYHLDPGELLERLRRRDRVSPRRALRTFYELYAEHQGKPRWGDKTPSYARHMRRLSVVLPEARFVHLIRDGRDAALSRADRAKKPFPPEVAATRWKRWIGRARQQGAQAGHYLEVRYEDLVSDPEPALRRICDYVALDWDPAMLRYHEHAGERLAEIDRDLPEGGGKKQRSGARRMEIHALATQPPTTGRVARWKSEMSDADVADFEAIAGDLLGELGYELTSR